MTAGLRLDPNLRDPDGFYSALIAAHDGLSPAQSALLEARLVLVLANHVGDPTVLADALALAARAVRQETDDDRRGGIPDDHDPP